VNIVAADPHARVLSEEEIVALLQEPLVLRLGVVDAHGWPLVHPVWHLFEDGVFRLGVTKRSVKAQRLRAEQRAYFTVDTTGPDGARGVRGRAGARVIDDDAGLAVEVTRKQLLKYMGTDRGPLADELLTWAREGNTSVVELAPLRFAAFRY
jgi:nitroimidazol reductase NimA-like FMN-containing flavoprotein (pyridoxamine 5'-phosphate oxidase superfamily)